MKKLDKIICINGFAGSGKDTLADHIISTYEKGSIEDYGHFYMKFSLGDGVRDTCKTIFNINDKLFNKYFFNRKYKEKIIPGYNYSSREMCQIVGHNMKSLFYPTIWCDRLMFSVDIKLYTNIVISDIRYQDEVDYFRQKCKSLLVVKIDRIGFYGNVGVQNSGSEGNPVKYDILLHNDSTKKSLYKDFEIYLRSYGKFNI